MNTYELICMGKRLSRIMVEHRGEFFKIKFRNIRQSLDSSQTSMRADPRIERLNQILLFVSE